MTIRRLVPTEAPQYRALMLEAYESHPDAFTSSVSERAALPLSWWESRLAAGHEPSEVVEPFAVAVASGYVSKLHMWCAVDASIKSPLPRS